MSENLRILRHFIHRSNMLSARRGVIFVGRYGWRGTGAGSERTYLIAYEGNGLQGIMVRGGAEA